jgi:hypothetical protein
VLNFGVKKQEFPHKTKNSAPNKLTPIPNHLVTHKKNIQILYTAGYQSNVKKEGNELSRKMYKRRENMRN